MSKFIKVLKSKTFWTIVIMFLMNVVPLFHNSLPTDLFNALEGLLSVLAVTFHVNPSQNYAGTE